MGMTESSSDEHVDGFVCFEVCGYRYRCRAVTAVSTPMLRLPCQGPSQCVSSASQALPTATTTAAGAGLN